jgi:hypothetical protein
MRRFGVPRGALKVAGLEAIWLLLWWVAATGPNASDATETPDHPPTPPPEFTDAASLGTLELG